MKTFALIGAAGYIAPKHMKAIRKTGHKLVAALDPHDSVGILDSYFPDCHFFTEFERFDRHLEKLKRRGEKVDYLSICSPNYLHDAHIRYGLRYGADVICEKPMVLNPWNITAIKEMEAESDNTVYNILQLRLHPKVIKLKRSIDRRNSDKMHHVNLTYITSRGNWYHNSWKGDVSKSGGIATNIGIHFFDMLIWLFGDVQNYEIQEYTNKKASGFLQLEKAEVKWFLSLDQNSLPSDTEKRSLRKLTIDKEEVQFTDGFEELHELSYRNIMKGDGFRINEVEKAINLISQFRTKA